MVAKGCRCYHCCRSFRITIRRNAGECQRCAGGQDCAEASWKEGNRYAVRVIASGFCKAATYSVDSIRSGSSGFVILARVVLGHPYMAEGPLTGQGRPPICSPHNVPHDSVIARPGTPKGQVRGKHIHWEFVVPSEQAYPELVIPSVMSSFDSDISQPLIIENVLSGRRLFAQSGKDGNLGFGATVGWPGAEDQLWF